jgi:hypothetical protein
MEYGHLIESIMVVVSIWWDDGPGEAKVIFIRNMIMASIGSTTPTNLNNQSSLLPPPTTESFIRVGTGSFGIRRAEDTGSFSNLFNNQSGLDSLMNKPTGLDNLLAQPSILLAAGNGNQSQRTTISVNAPVQNAFGVVDKTRSIDISVRPLTGSELGSLNTSPANIQKQLDAASANIDTENQRAYGSTTVELRDQAIDAGYYRSPAHNAWAQAAEARTGGRVPAEWWITNDPFGGTAGNGPNVLPSGTYPGVASRIAMGHDTDWTLGRQFGAGPLSALQGSNASPEDMGSYGLVPNHSINRGLNDIYSDPGGHRDWTVTYSNPW